jgi:hypothetical protein
MNHSSNIFIIVLLTVFLLTVPCGGNAGDTYQELINCDLHQGACAQILSEVTVTLDVTPKPIKAMQALLFKVTLTGNPPPHAKAAHIDLGMPGMNMGPNRVLLKSVGSGIYEGQGVIVRCPSGRRTWRATVSIPTVGQSDFVFDVIY